MNAEPAASDFAVHVPVADEIDRLRAIEYRLIAALLARAPDRATLDLVAGLRGDASPLGLAHTALAQAAACADAKVVEREHFRLFIGVGRGELLPFASYYLTGFLNERPLAEVRAELSALGLERARDIYDPEDHLAILADTVAILAEGQLAGVDDAGRGFFTRHLAPWAGRFFADLARAPSADFYQAVAGVGSTFFEIEVRACSMEE